MAFWAEKFFDSANEMTWLKPRVHGGCRQIPAEETGGLWPVFV